MNYDYKKTLKKGLQFAVAFVIPFLINAFIAELPQVANITIGGLLLMLVNMLKHKYGMKFGGLL